GFDTSVVQQHKGAITATLVSIILRANRGSFPFLTFLSDHAAVSVAPTSVPISGINPNIPISAKVRPDSSCRYPGNQNKQKYHTGSLTKRMINIPHSDCVLQSCPHVKPVLVSFSALSLMTSCTISAGGSV